MSFETWKAQPQITSIPISGLASRPKGLGGQNGFKDSSMYSMLFCTRKAVRNIFEWHFSWIYSIVYNTCTLLAEQSKFPRYNMKCRGKRDTTWNITRNVSRFPRYISSYISESRLPLGQCTYSKNINRQMNYSTINIIANTSPLA